MRQLTQTTERQNAILELAEKRGELTRFAWFVEVHALDKRYRGSDGKRYFCFEYPRPRIPVVPITGDGVAERVAIELLVLLAEEANVGKRLEFYPALGWAHETEQAPYYNYGDLVRPDLICMTCGAVTQCPQDELPDTDPLPCPACGADVALPTIFQK